MYSESSEIVITQHLVKQAADKMLYCSTNRFTSPLHTLILVDEIVTHPHRPSTPYNRQLGLQQIISQIITDVFVHQCQRLDLPVPDLSDSIQTAANIIRKIARLDNPELIGWGWLYYHYICIDLGITQAIYRQLIHVNARTLRRYQQHAFRRLTERLIELESMARSKTPQRMC